MPIIKLIQAKELSPQPLFETRLNSDDRTLESSLKKHGIITPPILIYQENKLCVLDGSVRLKIAQKLGHEKTHCLVYEKNELNNREAFSLCLELNRWGRGFNIVEKALCLKAANQIYTNGTKIPKSFWESVGIKQNIKTIHQHSELLKLSPLILKHAINNNIPLPIILGFLRFPVQERDKLAKKLFLLPINQNKLAEIISTAYDISKRENILPSKLLDELISSSGGRAANAAQKAQNLRHLLQKRKNPNYTTQLFEFEKTLKKLPLNNKVKVLPAPYFEEDFVEISARIHTKEDIDSLQKLLTNQEWSDLLSSLS